MIKWGGGGGGGGSAPLVSKVGGGGGGGGGAEAPPAPPISPPLMSEYNHVSTSWHLSITTRLASAHLRSVNHNKSDN